jgi:hypothetical protein
MRHLWSLLAGLVAAPAIWLLVAAGQNESSETVARWVKNDTYNWANLISPTVYLAAGAVVLGLIAVLRVSPMGPIVAGLLLVAPYAGMYLSPFKVRDAVPDRLSLFGNKVPMDVALDNGTIFLIGATLLLATFSAQRWRSWPQQDGGPSDDSGLIDWQSGSSDSSPPSLGYPSPDAPLQTTSAGGSSAWPPPARAGAGWDDRTR